MTVRDLLRKRLLPAALAGVALAAAAAAQAPVIPPPPVSTPDAAVIPPAPVLPVAPVAAAPAPILPPAPTPTPVGPPAGVKLPPLVLPTSTVAADPPKAADAPKPAPTPTREQAPVPAPTLAPKPVTPPAVEVKPAPAPAPPAVPMLPPAVVAPAPEAAPPKVVVKEAAKTIPAEPVIPVAAKPAAPVDAPKVTGPSGVARSETPPSGVAELRVGTASTDPAVAFAAALRDARLAYSRVRDYSCHLLAQERVRGKLLPETTSELYARTTPNSVSMRAIAPAAQAGAEAVYVAGKNAGRVRVKAPGGAGAEAWHAVEPTDPRLTADGRANPADAGIGAILARVEHALAMEERMRNAVGVLSADYAYADRAVTRYELTMGRPHALRYAHHLVVYIDKETKLPVRLEVYDTPTAADPDGALVECQSCVNVRVNPGVPDAAFEK